MLLSFFIQITAEKWKTPLYVKIARNWWNYNGMMENYIPLSGIGMD